MAHEQTQQDGRGDFDFYHGSWKIFNRRLRERLKGSTSWEEFEGTSDCQPVLGGIGNVDEVSFTRDSGVSHGLTVRLFNPTSQQWSIYWADSTHGTMENPMVGSFDGDHGEFYTQEPFEGRAIFSRFLWTKGTNLCKWEQAFSADGGKTWETNWTMEMTR